MRAVLEGAGSERALVLGGAEGGQMAALFAATYPELTAGLVLFQFEARGGGADSPEWHQAHTQLGRWGTQGLADEWLAQICPTLLRSEADRIWFANHLRTGASPEIGYALNEAYYASDVSDILSTIRVPTLLLYRGEAMRAGAEDAAAIIPGARVEALAGSDYWGMFLSPEIVDRVEAFSATLEVEPEPESVLATVLFTDLVESSAKAAELGDRKWRDLLAEHHSRVRRELARYRGIELDTAGDGFFARFRRPGARDSLRLRDPRGGQGAGAGRSVRASTRASANCSRGRLPASPLRSEHEWRIGQGLEMFSSLQTVKDLVAGSGLAFEDRGVAELKGIPGEWRLYAALVA